MLMRRDEPLTGNWGASCNNILRGKYVYVTAASPWVHVQDLEGWLLFWDLKFTKICAATTSPGSEFHELVMWQVSKAFPRKAFPFIPLKTCILSPSSWNPALHSKALWRTALSQGPLIKQNVFFSVSFQNKYHLHLLCKCLVTLKPPQPVRRKSTAERTKTLQSTKRNILLEEKNKENIWVMKNC